EVEARRARGLQVGPRCCVLGVEPDLDLFVLPSKHSFYHVEIDRCVHDLPFMGLLKNIPWFFRNRWFFRTLCEDYTPKSKVAESRPIPLSFVPFSGLSGVFPASGQGLPDGPCQEFVKKSAYSLGGPQAGRGSGVKGRAGRPA